MRTDTLANTFPPEPKVTLSLSRTAYTDTSPITVTADFSVDVILSGFIFPPFMITTNNASTGTLTKVNDRKYTVLVTPNDGASGDIVVLLLGGSFAAGSKPGILAGNFDESITIRDGVPPEVVNVSAPENYSSLEPLTIVVTFNELVKGFNENIDSFVSNAGTNSVIELKAGEDIDSVFTLTIKPGTDISGPIGFRIPGAEPVPDRAKQEPSPSRRSEIIAVIPETVRAGALNDDAAVPRLSAGR